MQYKLIALPAFHVAGIAVRTTNRNGQSQKDIGLLWQEFMEKNIAASIPNKLSEDIYCVYMDYENGADGAYTTVLGCKVSAGDAAGEFVIRTIPASSYRLYHSKGKLPDAVVHTWMNIWQASVNRKFAADFDVYGSKAKDPANAEVETYLSVPGDQA